MNNICVAVHGGAGVHNPSSDHELKKALRRSCSQALDALLQGGSALSAVEDAVSVLEDEPCLNAGLGSNLTLDGCVECDAALMDGRTGDFGSAGAVSGVKNPIRLARAVLDHAHAPDPLGRLAPLTLVSAGAHAFAAAAGLRIVPPESLVTSRAMAEWRMWKWRLEEASDTPAPRVEEARLNDLQDTVGAVVGDAGGGMAAGVSSGGLLLKCPGRIGEAAVFGAGCWATKGLACSVSGAGEHITRTMLARAVGDALCSSVGDYDPHEVLRGVLVDAFWRACRERGESECNAGVLLLTKEDDGDGMCVPRLWCAFTTPSMAIAYASSKHPTPKALVLRRPKSSRPVNGENPPIFITALPL